MRVNLPLLKDCIEMLGLALATDHHVWTMEQRRLWERSWAEIRRHQNPPVAVDAVFALQRDYRKAFKALSIKERQELVRRRRLAA